MQGNSKVYAKKTGSIYKVYLNTGNNQPLPLSDFDDNPPGGFPMTYLSEGELKAAFPRREFIFFSPPSSGKQSIVEPVDTKILDAELSKYRTTQSSPPTHEAKVEELAKPCSSTKSRCTEFMAMLTMAARYASEENKAILKTKIETVEELIQYVFRG